MEITTQIHALKIPFQVPVSPDRKVERFVYVYVLFGKRIWLIDTGVAAAADTIFDSIKRAGRRISDLAGIILTHSHPDHIGSARQIQDATGCMIAAHAAERDWIEDVDLQSRERPVPGFSSLVNGSVKVDRILAEGDRLDLGDGLEPEVLHTPGHSRGSISLFLPEQGILFSGDAVPVPGEMPVYDDAGASAASIKKIERAGKIRLLLASWDDPRHDGAAAGVLDNGLAYLNRIHRAVLKAARSGPEDAMGLCARALADLHLPPAMAIPLVVRSFQANLRIREKQDLLPE